MAKTVRIGYDRTYCYPETNVLKNKKGITDSDTLHRYERDCTLLRTLELKGCISHSEKLDFSYLMKIHEYLFQDVYEWAGKPRTVDMGKTECFCFSVNILSFAKSIFDELEKNNFLKGLDEDVFIQKLAVLYGDINALHPFREGNGRATRFFIEETARRAGYELDLSLVNKEKLISASEKSIQCDNAELYDILKENIQLIQSAKERNQATRTGDFSPILKRRKSAPDRENKGKEIKYKKDKLNR